ncbi:WS/DGAT domain-containing protein [Skermania piniformis]
MLGARLSIGDATAYLMSTPDRVTDWVMYWVFDNGPAGAPSAIELTEHLTSRVGHLDVLNRHVADVPGHLGNPYWVAGTTSLSARLQIDETPTTWSAALAAMATAFDRPLDLQETTWRLTGYTHVSGAPGATGPSTLLFAQVSHAVLVGAQIEGMSQALFGADPAPLHIAGLGKPLARPRPVRATLLGAARLPYEIVRWQARHARHAVAQTRRRRPPLVTDRTPTLFNIAPDPDRPVERPQIRVVRPDLTGARGRGVTVTALGLTAVSIAVQRYLRALDQNCPDDLAGLVLVAVGDPRGVLGVNRVNAAQADLYPGVVDPAARARAIHAALQYTRRSQQDVAAERIETGAATPFAVYPKLLRRVENLPTPSRWATAVTSVRRVGEHADWSVTRRPYVFGGHAINVGTDIGLVHSFVGGKDDLTVSAIAAPSVVTQIDTYADLLGEAFTEVVTALRTARVARRP